MRRAAFTLDQFKDSPAGKRADNAHLFKSKAKKRPKYGNSKVEIDGLVFDSKKEYRRYLELLSMMKHGAIGQLERQVRYELIPASESERACEYVADFRYLTASGETVIEDVKSDATRVLSTYILKRKLMLSVHGISIREV